MNLGERFRDQLRRQLGTDDLHEQQADILDGQEEAIVALTAVLGDAERAAQSAHAAELGVATANARLELLPELLSTLCRVEIRLRETEFRAQKRDRRVQALHDRFARYEKALQAEIRRRERLEERILSLGHALAVDLTANDSPEVPLERRETEYALWDPHLG